VRKILITGIILTLVVFNLGIAKEKSNKKVLKTIFSYKKELNLTDEQIDKLHKILDEFTEQLKRKRLKLRVLNIEFNELIRNRASLDKIKSKLKEIAELEVEIRFLDIKSAREIEEVLTPEQLKKWNKIRKGKVKTKK